MGNNLLTVSIIFGILVIIIIFFYFYWTFIEPLIIKKQLEILKLTSNP